MDFDLCCLKRPFDDPSQARIRLENDAVLALLSHVGSRLELVHALAQDLENRQNPLAWRAARVSQLLALTPLAPTPGEEVIARTNHLRELGFRGFDAFHVASAEAAGAEVVATCDDQLLEVANRNAQALRVRVVDPLTLAREVLP